MCLLKFMMFLIKYLQSVWWNVSYLTSQLHLYEWLERVYLLLHLGLYDCKTLGKSHNRVVFLVLLHVYLLYAASTQSFILLNAEILYLLLLMNLADRLFTLLYELLLLWCKSEIALQLLLELKLILLLVLLKASLTL